MRGAIAGDIIGSIYEFDPIKHKDFPLFSPGSTFTDDTVLAVATADVLLNKGDYHSAYLKYGRAFHNLGYGSSFNSWLHSYDPQPYHSWGNGSAMRVSPVGYVFNSLEEVLHEAKNSAAVTHNHPEGIKGAQATASAVFLARIGYQKQDIKNYIEETFGYQLSRSMDSIRPTYTFNESCQGTVPEAIIAFLESTSVEDAIRNAISLGGDGDTLACIAGGIAEAFYKEIPYEMSARIQQILPEKLLQVIEPFYERFVYGNN